MVESISTIMKILISSSTLDVKNGYGNITYELVKELKNDGHNVTLLLPHDDEFSEYDIEGVNIERVLPPYIFACKSRHFLKYLFWRYKTDKNFDIVHSLFAFPYAPLLVREAKRFGIPCIVGAQGTYGVQPLTTFPERVFMKFAYRNARMIHVPSQYTKNAILKEAGENYYIKVIHNGVNYERFLNHEVKSIDKFKSYKTKKVLLTVGALKNRKGQALVVKALPKIVQKHPDVTYVMVGTPTDKISISELAKKLGVLNNIEIVGQVSDIDILDYFHICDVYVHTPRVSGGFQFEGFGIVYLEAAACRKPSVGADAGGISDALLDGVTGLIAPEDDVEKIAENIIKLLDDEKMRNDFGKAGREYAEKHTWEKITEQYTSMYKEITS
ncbi:MAG: phosphatidylinositol alpha-1,6-mannosyltransferase [Candidatus Paceibacteria bacterium]|jgi:phosphatidylinositol alpha-1,6-mannosyltransferase